MVFSSFVFLFYFLTTVLAGYFLLKSRTWRNVLLLFASLIFYAWGEPVYVVLMLISIVINWYLALVINSRVSLKKLFLSVGIILNLANICFFKYGNFFAANISALFSTSYGIPKIALPIGISFYTFQAISYLIDTYRGTIEPQKNPLFFGCYLSMFPQLIAGPIVRYKTIERELVDRNENLSNFVSGLSRFIIGLGKKVLIANSMGFVADRIFKVDPQLIGIIPAWYGFIAYSLQIYFDFSGYSDMAIGLGQMFGFHFLENFNYPYIARSITDFWRRWHISLSSFFRDYLYIPLGGNRVTMGRWLINLMVVWSLTGLWHGASWNFVCWGLYYCALLIGEKVFWGRWLKSIPVPVQHAYTIFFVIFGWVIFRIESFELVIEWIKSLFGFHGIGHPATLSALNILQYYPWFILAMAGSTPVFSKVLARLNRVQSICWLNQFYIVACFLWSIVKLATAGFNPFIYFRF